MKRLSTIAVLLASTCANAAWVYDSSTDAMTSKTTTHAMLESSNSLSLDSPYAGTNYGTITVRKHPRWGVDVMFSISKGQIMCSSYDCRIQVRFDENKPVIFSGQEPADNDSSVVFLNNEPRFIAMAKKAKKILVQASIYQNGAPILEFYAPKPLEWSPK